VTTDPLVLGEEVGRATARLLQSADALRGDSDLIAPSLLPGWTRGHVLTHLARNADALGNLLTWAQTGIVTPPYASPQARADGIEAGAARPIDEQMIDLRESCARFARLAADLPAEAWSVQLPLPDGRQRAAFVMWRRLREVEVHHVDLDTGYQPDDWPDSFAHRLLHEVATTLNVAGPADKVAVTVRSTDLDRSFDLGAGGPPTVTGTSATLAGWLTGRTPRVALTVDPPGPLPSLPAWI
jgi:maleylpyruvate isomerase